MLGNAAALGSSTGGAKTVAVNSGGQIDLNNQSPTARTYSFEIAGTGDGTGALVNSTGGGIASNAGILNLELLDNATVGGASRFDIGFAGGAGGVITGNGKTLTKTGANQINLRGDASGTPINIVVSQGTLGLENSDYAFGGTTGTVTVANGATVSSYGARTIDTPVTLQAGATLGSLGGGTGTWTGALTLSGDSNINPAALANTITLNGIISGTGGLTVVGTNGGTVNFNGANTFTGGLQVGPSPSSVASPPATTVNIASTSSLDVGAGKLVRIANNTGSGAGIQTLNVNGSVTNAGSLYIGRPGVLNINSGGTWSQSGDASINAHGGYSSDMNVLTGGSFTYTGLNNFKVEPASGNGGNATLDISGTFTTSKGFERTVVTSSGTGTVTMAGGTLTLSGNVPSMTVGNVLFVLGTGGGTINTNGFNGTINAAISGGSALVKSGLGTLTLDGNNSYTGTTTVQAGTLAGKGAAASALSVSSGAAVAPGVGIGTFTSSSAVFAAGATLAIEVSSTSATADKLTASGPVDITGANVSFTEIGSGTIPAGTELVVLDYTGTTLTGTFGGYAEGATVSVGSNTFTLSYVDSSRVTLTSTTVASPFAAWATTNITNINPAAPAGFDDDADGDGFANGLEWILGGGPLAQDASTLVTTTATASGGLTLSFKRADESIGQATLEVEYDADLAGTWTSVNIEATPPFANGVTVGITPGSPEDTITVNIPASPNAPAGKLFGRIKASQP